jgi:ABC-2 type transport system permease protein
MSDLALPRPATLRPASAVRDGLTMVARCVRLSQRTIDALIMSFVLPVMLMVMFVYLFGGAMNTGGKYVTYVVPGVILLCVGFASAQTAVSVSQDMKNGVIDRFRSMDIGGASVLFGHVVASVLRNIIATVMVIGVALLIGFRPHASVLDWVATAGVLLVFMVAISWLAAAFGVLAGNPEAAAGFTFFVSFLPYPSSAFVPISTMPSWLQGFSRNQPITPVIETVRGLLLDLPVGAHAWQALAWCAGILVASIAAAAALFRRRTS